MIKLHIGPEENPMIVIQINGPNIVYWAITLAAFAALCSIML